MKMTRWNPFMDPFNFDQEFNEFFNELSPRSMMAQAPVPSMNMYEKDHQLMVEMSIPGLDIGKVDVQIDEKNVLTVKGSTKKQTEVDDKNYYRKEIRQGSFSRSIQLPSMVLGDDAAAEYEDGMLLITVPMKKESEAKSIKVEKKKKLDSGN